MLKPPDNHQSLYSSIHTVSLFPAVQCKDVVVYMLLLEEFYWTLTYFNCTGGGIELPAHYPQWKVEHGKMEPPNIILASLNKLMEGEFLHQVAVVMIYLLSLALTFSLAPFLLSSSLSLPPPPPPLQHVMIPH